MTADEDETFELADLVNTNSAGATLLALFYGLFACARFSFAIVIGRDASKVRMIAGIQPTTSMALATGYQVA